MNEPERALLNALDAALIEYDDADAEAREAQALSRRREDKRNRLFEDARSLRMSLQALRGEDINAGTANKQNHERVSELRKRR